MTGRLALAVLLAGAAAGWGARAAATETAAFGTAGTVEAIAADGRRVAIAVRNPRGCDQVVVWTAGTRAAQSLDSKTACAGAAFHRISEVAIASTRVAWVAATGGNVEDQALEVARVGRPDVSVVARASNQGGAGGGLDGDWIGHLSGDGSLLVLNTWRQCSVRRPDGAAPCPAGGTRAGDLIYTRQTLWKLQATSKVKVASGPEAFSVVSASGGRIAVQDPRDGGVSILDAAGRTVTAGAITAGSDAGTAYQGTEVVTLRGGTIQAYNASSGHLDASVSVAAGPPPVLRDLQDGLAVYVRGRQVHVVRLADGKDAAFVAPGKGTVDAQIEPAGLSYAYSVVRGRTRGHVVFVPAADLQARLG